MTAPLEVVVIGGGYAGVMAANRLTRRDDVSVTLINPRPVFVERLRLHQLVRGNHEAVVDYRDVLAERVRLRTATVDRIDAPTRSLTLTDGATVGYDYLIYAVGSGSPAAPEHSHPIATFEDARRLRPLVEAASAVTVVGAGPTGIETAAELAEAGHSVTLVCGDVLNPYLHARGRRSVARQLNRLGVRVIDGPGATVTAVTRDAVRLADGRELPSPLTIWAAGFSVPDLASRSGLTTDELGRLITDETLTSVDDPRIVAAGDAASPSGMPYRMGCQSAVQLGPQAAETVLSRIAGASPVAAVAGFAGQCISLGRRAGIFQVARRDDHAVPLHLGGRPGGLLKEFVVVHTVKQLADEARRPGARDLWVHDRKRTQAIPAAPTAALPVA